jgi:hypothetical protein
VAVQARRGWPTVPVEPALALRQVEATVAGASHEMSGMKRLRRSAGR